MGVNIDYTLLAGHYTGSGCPAVSPRLVDTRSETYLPNPTHRRWHT